MGFSAADAPVVVVSLDQTFARHAAVTLMSVLSHTPEARLFALVPENFGQQQALQDAVGPALTIVPASMTAFDTLQLWSGASPAVYLRLLLGDVLPVRRAIFLDCDIVVRSSLMPLWNQALGDAIIGAVPDPAFADHARLGLAPGAAYFNAGVMLIDLEQWRAVEIGARSIAWAQANPHRMTFSDQCVLNWLLQDQWMAIDQTWNHQAGHCGRRTRGGFVFDRAAIGDPAIVHYNAPPDYGRRGDCEGKPWMYLCQHPWTFEYRRIAAHTPWAGLVAADSYPHNRVLRTLRSNADWATPAYRALRRVI